MCTDDLKVESKLWGTKVTNGVRVEETCWSMGKCAESTWYTHRKGWGAGSVGKAFVTQG